MWNIYEIIHKDNKFLGVISEKTTKQKSRCLIGIFYLINIHKGVF